MSRSIAVLFVMAISLAARGADAQESTARPGAVEVTYMPAGAAFFTSKDDSSGETDPTPNFGNYTFGTAVTVNLNRVIGIEGEIGSMIATKSGLQFGTLGDDLKAPNMLSYTGNVVLSPWTGHALVPYATGGIGGMTMFERPRLGVLSDETFLTGNVGGGVKWYAANKRWGLRGDYRFAATRGKDDAPEFYGRDTRYAHRVYAGVMIGTGTRRTAPRPPATPATPAPPIAAAPPPPPPVQQQVSVREVEEVEVEETIEFAVLDDVQFDFDQAVPRADALPALQQAVSALEAEHRPSSGHRRPRQQRGHGGVQPCARRTARVVGQGLHRRQRDRRVAAADHQLRRRAAQVRQFDGRDPTPESPCRIRTRRPEQQRPAIVGAVEATRAKHAPADAGPDCGLRTSASGLSRATARSAFPNAPAQTAPPLARVQRVDRMS